MTMPGGTSSPPGVSTHAWNKLNCRVCEETPTFKPCEPAAMLLVLPLILSCRVLNPPAGLVTARANKD